MFQLDLKEKILILSATLSLFIIRTWVTIMLVFFSKTGMWEQISNDGIEHFQIGFLMMLGGILLQKKVKGLLPVLLTGAGVGLFVDETYQIIFSFLKLPYMPGSLIDWVFLLAAYGLFLSIVFLKRRKSYVR